MANVEKTYNNLNGDNQESKHNWNWPTIKSKYKQLSKKHFVAGEDEKGIYFDSIGLSSGFVAAELDHVNTKKISEVAVTEAIQLHVEMEEDKLMDFITDNLTNVKIGSQETKPAFNEYTGYEQLLAKCNELPNEWNVVQISQMSDEYLGYATKKDFLTQDFPLRLTLFRYNQSDRLNNKPISFAMEPSPFLSTAYLVYHELFKMYSQVHSTNEFNVFSAKLNVEHSKLRTSMSLWLGPWVTMFSGKIKGDDGKQLEQNLFDEVDTFCKTEMTDEQYVLICIVARRLDLLDTRRITQAAEQIGVNQPQRNRLKRFFAQMKKKYPLRSYEHYPCILIIEETLDSMPWEIVVYGQEFCRFNSIYLLFDLYEEYKGQIDDGYVQLEIKSGRILINPDDDEKLSKMKQRMTNFYANWMPDWKCISGKVPSEEEMQDLLCGGIEKSLF